VIDQKLHPHAGALVRFTVQRDDVDLGDCGRIWRTDEPHQQHSHTCSNPDCRVWPNVPGLNRGWARDVPECQMEVIDRTLPDLIAAAIQASVRKHSLDDHQLYMMGDPEDGLGNDTATLIALDVVAAIKAGAAKEETSDAQ
jgi:hypothetical protein